MIPIRKKEAKDILEAIQSRASSYTRKTIYNPYKKKFQPVQKSNKKLLQTRLPFFPSTQSTWEGDNMNKSVNENFIRFWHQNCNGIKINDTSNIQHNFTQIHENNIHYFSFSETNFNVSSPTAQAQIHKCFNERFKAGRITNTNTPGFPRSTSFQPGGVTSGFGVHLQTRYMSVEKDDLGRWHCHNFRGKERDLKIYTVYRVHRKSDESAGVTTAWSQQRTILRTRGIQKNPRDDVMDSLCNSVRKDVESGKSIIIMGDFNEGIDDREKSNERLKEIGLVNLMQERIGDDLPKTWNRGRTAIDHVYMSIDVFKSVRRAGYAPFNTIALSDHRGIFFDLDKRILFEDDVYHVEPASFRRLKSTHPKHVRAYQKNLSQQWKIHKIDERLKEIISLFYSIGLTDGNIKALNGIDNQITEIMRFLEKNCSKISRHAIDPWSPGLRSLAREIRFLIIKIKNTLRDMVPTSMVKSLNKVNTFSEKLKEKRTEYRVYLKNAAAHRKTHLDERAQYHSEQNPRTTKASEVKRLKNIEVQIKDSVKIQFTLKDTHQDSSTYLLIPATKEYEIFENFDGNILSVSNIWRRILIRNGDDIKDWVRVTDKNLIEDMLLQWQVHHFEQANGTPFTDSFWTKELGKQEVSDAIIAGTYEPPRDLPWEAEAILKSMKRSQKIKKEIDESTTLEQFSNFFKNSKESTSSSPSGRHYGHFKAILQMDTSYIECIHSILDVCTKYDIILERWKPTLCALIEKKSGKPFIHKYRTIHIIESDVQFISKQIYVLGMMRLAEKCNLITDQQYGGRNRRQCQSASLNKIAYYDLSRQLIMPCAFLDADAKACYDRIVHGLSGVEVRKWGVSHKSAAFTTKFLQSQQFHLRSAHGISRTYYSHSDKHPVQGSGQGIGWAGPRWTASSDGISEIMKEKCTGMLFEDPEKDIVVKRNGDIFVDDLDIGVTQSAIKDDKKTPLDCLQEDEQIHALLLNSEGHGLNPIKCSYYYVDYKREDLKHVQLNKKELPGELKVQVSFQTEPEPIKRLETTTPHKTLGIHPTVSGLRIPQLDKLREKIKKWARNVRSSSLTSREKLVAYFGYILKSIQFVVSTTSLNAEECNELDKIISPVLLHAVQVHKNASRTPLYAPKSFGGYGFIPVYHVQGLEKSKFLLIHYRLHDTTGQLIKISMRYTQMEIGTSTPFYLLQHENYRMYATDTWTTQLWEYLCACKTRFVETKPWNYVQPRENDFFLMDIISQTDMSERNKVIFNQIRLYLKLITASDIIDPETNRVYQHVLECKPTIQSRLGWPNIHPFPKSWIQLWKSMITSFIIPKLRLLPLGTWRKQTHQILLEPINMKKIQKKFKHEYPTLILEDVALNSKLFSKVVQRINTTMRSADKWKQSIWGIKGIPRKTIHTILFEYLRGNLIAATDASVKYGRAGHAFCYANKKTGKILFSSGSKVCGSIKFTTSYRAEMMSIIAGLTLLDLILRAAGISKAKVVLHTDSETSILVTKNSRLNTLHYALTNDIDVALQLRHEWTTIPQQFSLQHVKGHQDKNTKFKDLSIPSQLNVLMDEMSKDIVDKTFNDSNVILPLPAQQIYFDHSQPIVQDITNVLISSHQNKSIKDYYHKHHNIPKHCFHTIEWDAIKNAFISVYSSGRLICANVGD